MSTENDIVEARIAQETQKVKVDSYQKVASIGGWAGGGRTLWAISFLGAVAGAAIGLAAPLFPMLVGATTLSVALAVIPASVLVFAATGMLTGFGGGLFLGRISGSAAAVGEEQEKRMKEWMIRQKLHDNPNATIAPDAPPAPEPVRSAMQRSRDTWRTYFNPRVGLVMTAIGIAGGLLLGAAFLATGGSAGFLVVGTADIMAKITGIAMTVHAPAAVMAYSAGVMGMFGATWFLNFPEITSKVTTFFGNLVGGKMLGREWGPAQHSPQPAMHKSEPEHAQDTPPTERISPRSLKPSYASYQEMLAAQDATAQQAPIR